MTGAMGRIRTWCRGDAGMTLLELMIAAVILLIAVSALLGLLLKSTQMSVQAKEQNVATAASHSYLEAVRSMPFASVGVAGGAGGSIEGSLPVNTVARSGSFEITITPTVTWVDDPAISGVQNYKQVVVVVSVGALTRRPVVQTYATYVRAPGEIVAIPGGTTGGTGGTAVPVISFVDGQAPASGAVIRGNSIMVTAHVSTPNTGGTIKRLQMFCGVPVLFGAGGGIPSNSGTTGEWIDLAVQSGTYSFYWNTLATQADGTPYYPDGQRKIYIVAYDNQSRPGTVERWVTIDNQPPTACSSPPVPVENSDHTITIAWGPSMDGAGVSDYATYYTVHPWSDRAGVSGTPIAGSGPTGWNDVPDSGAVHFVSPTYDPAAPSYRWTSALPFTRYWFRILPANSFGQSPSANGGMTDQTVVPLVTRPKIKGTYQSTKTGSGSNEKITTNLTLAITPPTFSTSAISYQVWRSTNGVTWPAGDAANQFAAAGPTYTRSDEALGNKAVVAAYYYKYVVTFTPGGNKDATSRTIESHVVGPVPATVAATAAALPGSDSF